MRRLPLLLALATCPAVAADFTLSVDAGDMPGRIGQPHAYDRAGCHGQNIAPALHWSDPPPGTRSFAVSVFDRDAPGGFWHWFVTGLPADSRALSGGGALPPGAHALRNDFGEAGWGGPCPPAGDPPHHYVFTVYALDVPDPALGAGTSDQHATDALRGHVLGTARTVLAYGR